MNRGLAVAQGVMAFPWSWGGGGVVVFRWPRGQLCRRNVTTRPSGLAGPLQPDPFVSFVTNVRHKPKGSPEVVAKGREFPLVSLVDWFEVAFRVWFYS